MGLGRCVTLQGRPKIRYPTLEQALEAAGEVNAKNLLRGWDPVAPYQCQTHRCYHLGRTPKYRVHDVPGLREEIGERAWQNMISENQRNRRRRYRVLVGRTMAAVLRADARRCSSDQSRPGRTTGTPTVPSTGSSRTGTDLLSR